MVLLVICCSVYRQPAVKLSKTLGGKLSAKSGSLRVSALQQQYGRVTGENRPLGLFIVLTGIIRGLRETHVLCGGIVGLQFMELPVARR